MKKHTNILLALCLVLPTAAHAATIGVTNTVAGIATEIVIEDVIANSSVAVSITSPLGDTVDYTLHSGNEGIAHTWIAGNDLQFAGDYHVRAENSSAVLTVHPDSIDARTSFIDIETRTVNVGEETRATVVLNDRYGNPLPGRAVELISSRADDLVQGLARETNEYGEINFVVRASSAGDIALRAIDLISGETLEDVAQIAAGTSQYAMGGPQFYRAQVFEQEEPQFEKIEIIIEGQEGVEKPVLQAGKAATMTLRAVDQFGNRDRNFKGMAYMATTDEQAELPLFGAYDFRFQDEGQKILTLGLNFKSQGEHTMVITEEPDTIPENLEDALGYLDVSVINKTSAPGGSQKIFVTNPRAQSLLGASNLLNGNQILVEGRGREFINIAITGEGIDVQGETDREGNFSIPVTIDTSKTELRFVVEDIQAPQNNSDEVEVRIDVTAPALDISFAPEEPIEQSEVLIVVQTEPSVEDVYLEVGETQYAMITSDLSSGKYQYLLNVPEAGILEATVHTTDTLGNKASQTVLIPVGLRDLPRVENPIAEAQINAIALRWDPVTQTDITGYRIYVGTEPNNFIHTLDTESQDASATVAGLPPGSTYYFSVLAIDGKRESKEKSETVSATVLGVQLKTTPGDGSVFIEWTSLDADLPLSSFIMSYGDTETNLTEERTLNSELRAITLRDLMNGVEYFFKLTPVSLTGEVLSDLAATGVATPNGDQYTAGISDPVPFDLRAGGGPLHTSAPPSTRPPVQMPLSEEGLPAWVILSVLVASAFTYTYYLQRRKVPAVTKTYFDAINNG